VPIDRPNAIETIRSPVRAVRALGKAALPMGLTLGDT
jgi:hypothetical protein